MSAVGIYRGLVTMIEPGGRPYVEVPRLTPGFNYGPLELPVGMAVSPGDRVAIGFVEGKPDDLILLASYGQ